MEMNDLAVINRARQGDRAAFGMLIERYEAMVKGIAIKIVHKDALAQELTQETMLQAYLSLKDLRDDARFQSWLYGIALNVCRSHVRAQKIDFMSLESLQGGMYIDASLLSDPEPDPQSVAEARDLHCRVLDAVNALSSKNRTATLLFYFDQLTVLEIADILGVTVSAVKGRLHKSRRQLRAQLMPLYDELQPKSEEIRSTVDTPERKQIMSEKAMVEVKVADVVQKWNGSTDPVQYHSIVLLSDEVNKRVLLIWIAPEQAENIILHLTDIETPRPMTYTLMANLLDAVGAEVQAVHIDALQNQTYISTIQLKVGEITETVDARPSDAINLAIRLNCPLYVSEDVMAEASIDLSDKDTLPKGRSLDLMKRLRSDKTLPEHWLLAFRKQRIFERAAAEAVKRKHEALDSGHLLWIYLEDEDEGATKFLVEVGLDITEVQSNLDSALGVGNFELMFGPVQPTDHVKRVITYAFSELDEADVPYIGSEYFLLGLLKEGEGIALEVLSQYPAFTEEALRGFISAEVQRRRDEAEKEAAVANSPQNEIVEYALGE